MQSNEQLANMPVETILTHWPNSIILFRRYQLLDCIGCQVAPFCLLSEAIETHGVDPAEFLRELREQINANEQ